MKYLKFILLLILILLLIFLTNKFLLEKEKAKIIPYGRKINILGKNINVLEIGPKDKQAIILLPGYGTIAPALDYRPFIEKLADDFRVVAIEPFGYGDSDLTDRARTIENITEEIHMTIEELGYKDYILCAHSISGIYSIYYLNNYPDEVVGFIGLDTSVPNQLKYQQNTFFDNGRKFIKEFGLLRLIRFLYPQGFMATNHYYSDELKSQIKYRVNRDFANDNNLNEGLNFDRNWARVQDLYYPKNLKTIFFLSKKDTKEKNWRYIETKNAFKGDFGKIYLINGGHYLHRDNFEEISNTIKLEFTNRG